MRPATSAGVVRRWVRLYTVGLTDDLRDARRAEIESDLWAHADEAAAKGLSPAALDAEMLVRLILGVPADLVWRRSHQTASTASSRKERAMQATSSRSWLTIIGLVLAVPIAVLCAVVVAANVYVLVTGTGDAWALPYFALLLAGSAVAIAGILVVRRQPAVGAALAVAGSAVAGGTWWLSGAGDNPLLWGLVLFLPLSIIGIVRARQEMGLNHPHVA